MEYAVWQMSSSRIMLPPTPSTVLLLGKRELICLSGEVPGSVSWVLDLLLDTFV